MLLKLSILAVVIGCISEVTPQKAAGVDLNQYALVDPNTGVLLPTQGAELDSIGTNSLKFKAPNCNCGNYFCDCCVGMKVNKHVENVCARAEFDPSRLAARGSLRANNYAIWSDVLSPSNPPALCYGIAGSVKGCVRFYDLQIQGRNFHSCLQLSMKVSKFTVLKANVGCMNLGANGVHYSGPGIGTSAVERTVVTYRDI